MKTKKILVYERSRLWKPSQEEKFCLELILYGSEKEIEKVRAAVFNCEQEGS